MNAPRLSRAVASLSAAAVLLSTLFALPAAAREPGIDAHPAAPPSSSPLAAPAQANGRFVVKFKTGAQGAATARANAYGQAARTSGVSVKELRATARGAAVVQAAEDVTSGESAKVLASLRRQSNVEYAEPDTFVRPAATPNDPLYPRQWDLFEATGGMRVPAAWEMTSGLGTVVAVIDTGITPHSDLTGVVPGYDFISDPSISNDGDGRDGDATDAGDSCNGSSSSWHGTHVAGTIGAAANNGLGIAGVAYSSTILPIRALGACGGYLSDIADAVVWAAGGPVAGVPAATYHPKVINMSLGGDAPCSTYFQSALDFAASAGRRRRRGCRQREFSRLRLDTCELQQHHHRRRDRPRGQPGLLLQLRSRGGRERTRRRRLHRRGQHHPLDLERRHHRARAPKPTATCRAPRWPPRMLPA